MYNTDDVQMPTLDDVVVSVSKQPVLTAFADVTQVRWTVITQRFWLSSLKLYKYHQ